MGMRWQTLELYFRQLLAMRYPELPIPGEIFFACPTGSSTSRFQEWIETEMDIPAELKFYGNNAIKEAHNACQANRNDTVIAMPGRYNTEGDLTWSKSQTHLVGGGCNVNAYYGSGGEVIVRNLAATDAAYAMLMTGHYNQVHGIAFHNFGEDAACVSSFKEQGRNNHYHHCLFGGHVRAEQAGAAAATCFWNDSSVTAAGYGLHLTDCTVGLSGSTIRTANNSLMLFGPTGTVAAGSDVVLQNTVFAGRSQTAGCSAIKFQANYCVDRLFRVKDCLFYNFYDGNSSSMLTSAFDDNDLAGHIAIIENSFNYGWSSWGTRSPAGCWLTQAAAAADGGIATVET